MTAINPNNTTISANELASPLKIALAGLTMIQQALLEFYFETEEGKKQYIQVLGKDADGYITNFDESGSMEAWENLYAHEKKPTLVLSDYHKTTDNYIYIPKPITPIALENAAISLRKLLNNKPTNSSDFLQFSLDDQQSKVIDTPPPEHKEESIATLLTTTDTPEETKKDPIDTPAPEYEESIAAPLITTNKHEDLTKELDELLVFEEQKIPQNNESFSELEALDDLSLPEEKIEHAIPSFEETIEIKDANTIDSFSLEEFGEIDEIEEITIPDIDNSEEDKSSSDTLPSDDLEALLSELKAEDAKQKKQDSTPTEAKPSKNVTQKKPKEEKRWNILCGEYDDISYKTNTSKDTHFKLTNTLLPYLKDTIDFSKRSNYWMEMSYKYLSITIDPENKRIYSSISLEDKNFVYLCVKDIDEDQVELEEVDEQGIIQFKQENIKKKHFTYSFEAFLWTTSLIVSHGRLPDNVSPDKRISINNWLSLKEVEKFPHIMQIAAVFNQHTASLNEVATWMNLPKRYVYSFYNGVAALDMIEQDADKSNKGTLITMMKEEKESMLKKILFTKIM